MVEKEVAVRQDSTFDPCPHLADYYRWVDPDRGIRVYINFDTAERLQIHVLRGIDSKASVEVGGVLLGTTCLEEGRIIAVIDDFEPVPCSGSKGPLYSAISAAAKFEAVIQQHKSRSLSGLSVIGYYRSHKRDNLYLAPDDLAFIQRIFPAADNVFLLIKPLSRRACTGGFFFWEEGSIQAEFTLEVPFAPIRFPSSVLSDKDPIKDVLFPARLDLMEDPRAALPNEPEARFTTHWHGRKRDVVAAVLGIALSFGLFEYWQVRKSVVVTARPAAEQRPDGVQTAPSLVRPVSELPAPAVPIRTFPKDTRQVMAKPSVPALKPEEAPSLPVESVMSEPPTPAPAVIPSPALQNQTLTEILPLQAQPLISPPPSTPAQNTEPASEPVQMPLSTIHFVGPQITYRVNPAVPLDIRSLITGETQIDVTVSINAAGKVTEAQVTSLRGAAARLVGPEAIKAARLFRFQPAQENGRAVPGRMVLTFRFKRNNE